MDTAFVLAVRDMERFTVVVVEKEHSDLARLSSLLRREQFDVVRVRTTEEAVTFASSVRVDALLVDIREFKGCAELRTAKCFAETALVFHSSSQTVLPAYRKRIACDADLVLTHPVNSAFINRTLAGVILKRRWNALGARVQFIDY